MSLFTTKGIAIAGISAAVPRKRIDASTLTERFGEEYVDKFVKSTGISACHQTEDNQTASDLGFAAAENLIIKKKIKKDDIGILIFVSTSPDYRKPSTSCVLQMRLGLPMDCSCMDLVHGCAGFMYGHQTMEAMMQTSNSKYGILILGETTSKVIDKQDGNVMMFGDAGAAILYEHSENVENTTVLQADGKRFKCLIIPAGGFRDMHPENEYFVTDEGEKRSKYHMYMNGMDVFNFSCNDVLKTIKGYLSDIGKEADDFDIFACHQANNYIIQRLAKKLRLPKEKVPLCLDRYGNTSSVSIPLVLCDYYGDKEGEPQKVLASGFGIGLAWGVTSFDIDPLNIYPIIETTETFDEGIIM